MEETVYFERTLEFDRLLEETVAIANGENRWFVKEHWFTEDLEKVQIIDVKNEDHFENNYYGDLEIFLITFAEMAEEQRDRRTYELMPDAPGCRIKKSTTARSSRLRFKIYLKEYDILRDYSYTFVRPRTTYGFKIVLTPILKLVNAPNWTKKSRKNKRSKGHLLSELKTMSTNIGSLLKEKMFTDVILRCGNKKINAHRNILAARSTWFRNLFYKSSEDCVFTDLPTSSIKFNLDSTKANKVSSIIEDPKSSHDEDPKSRTSNEVTKSTPSEEPMSSSLGVKKYASADSKFIFYPKLNPEFVHEMDLDLYEFAIFEDFLHFIYSGVFEPCDVAKTMDLCMAASKYGVEDLEKKCVLNLENLTSEITSFNILDFACQNDYGILKFYVLDAIFKKEEIKIVRLKYLSDWDELLNTHGYLIDEIKYYYSSTALFHAFCALGQFIFGLDEFSDNALDDGYSDVLSDISELSNNSSLSGTSEIEY